MFPLPSGWLKEGVSKWCKSNSCFYNIRLLGSVPSSQKRALTKQILLPPRSSSLGYKLDMNKCPSKLDHNLNKFSITKSKIPITKSKKTQHAKLISLYKHMDKSQVLGFMKSLKRSQNLSLLLAQDSQHSFLSFKQRLLLEKLPRQFRQKIT